MNLRLLLTLCCLLLLLLQQTMAQGKKSRLQPGKIYEAGETIIAPRFGFTAKIPDGWQGKLPRETEVFLLQSVRPDIFGEIYVFGYAESDLQTLENSWLTGVDLSPSIRIKATAPVKKGDMLTSEVTGEGQSINKGNRGHIAARCNPDGPCIVALSRMPKQFYDQVKDVLEQFLSSGSFGQPTNTSPYADLDWNEFLAGKSLISYTAVQGGSKDTKVHLCADGSFTATINKRGFMRNQNPQYRGRLSGTWATQGTGESTRITFSFSSRRNLPPVEMELVLREDKVFANGERYFVGQSARCR